MTENEDLPRERILKAKYEVWQHREDGSKYLDDVETVEAVPKDDLRELIEEWRKQRTGHRDVDNAVEACADQLEALLDE